MEFIFLNEIMTLSKIRFGSRITLGISIQLFNLKTEKYLMTLERIISKLISSKIISQAF